jgi:hypothetical protein
MLAALRVVDHREAGQVLKEHKKDKKREKKRLKKVRYTSITYALLVLEEVLT